MVDVPGPESAVTMVRGLKTKKPMDERSQSGQQNRRHFRSPSSQQPAVGLRL
jgi:hypothetical protein